MKSPQEIIHWLERGGGARWIGRTAAFVAALLLTFWYGRQQFHGIADEFTMQQAVLARQVARGEGFTTLVNYPQTQAMLAARGEPFSEKHPYPELHHAPLYPLVLAGAFTVLPASIWEQRPSPPDGWTPDYVVFAVNALLFWLAVWLAWRLAKKLFDRRAAWLTAFGTALSVSLWEQVAVVSGVTVFLVLIAALFNVLASFEERVTESAAWSRALGVRVGALGLLSALLFLTEYSAGLVAPLIGAYVVWRAPGRTRGLAVGVFVAALLLPTVPWLTRNALVSGHPLGLAWQNLALKAGDSTAEPAAQRALGTSEPPAFDLKKLGNKGLTGLEQNLQARLWSGGGLLFTAFFVAGLAYQFRHGPVNRVRWAFGAVLLALLAGAPFFGSGESARLPVHYLAPMLIVFGSGFFLVLVDSQPRLAAHWQWAALALLLLQALPLVRDCLEPRKIHFHYPPYYPNLFMELRRDAEQRFLPGTGVCTDVPAGTAWYGRMRVWAKPERLRDFSQIIVDQNIGALLLTPVTLDRPFFTELAARKDDAISLSDTGGWGGVYAGLVTRRMPAGFPLSLPPQKLTENMVLLVNPQTLRR